MIDAASLSLADGGSVLSASAPIPLHFSGQPRLTLAPGAVLFSDALTLPVRAGQAVWLSLHIAKPFALAAGSPARLQLGNAWLMPGNQSMALQPRDAVALDWAPAFTALDVMAPREAGLLVAFGDSLTEGSDQTNSPLNDNYPSHLMQRLQKTPPPFAVINAGMAGSRLLHAGVDDSGLERFERDVLQQSGVCHVLVQIGINDIGYGTLHGARPKGVFLANQIVEAHQVVQGLQRIKSMAAARGIKVMLGTLAPFGDSPTWSPDNERKRQAVNQWIRGDGSTHAVVDFDTSLRDPVAPHRLRREFDSGDHIHPNAAGFAAMAMAVDLRPLQGAA